MVRTAGPADTAVDIVVSVDIERTPVISELAAS